MARPVLQTSIDCEYHKVGGLLPEAHTVAELIVLSVARPECSHHTHSGSAHAYGAHHCREQSPLVSKFQVKGARMPQHKRAQQYPGAPSLSQAGIQTTTAFTRFTNPCYLPTHLSGIPPSSKSTPSRTSGSHLHAPSLGHVFTISSHFNTFDFITGALPIGANRPRNMPSSMAILHNKPTTHPYLHAGPIEHRAPNESMVTKSKQGGQLEPNRKAVPRREQSAPTSSSTRAATPPLPPKPLTTMSTAAQDARRLSGAVIYPRRSPLARIPETGTDSKKNATCN